MEENKKTMGIPVKPWHYRHPFFGLILFSFLLFLIACFALVAFHTALAFAPLPEIEKPEILKAAAVKTHPEILAQTSKVPESTSSSVKASEAVSSTSPISQLQGFPQGVLYAPKDVVDIAHEVLANAQNTVNHVSHVVEAATQVIVVFVSIGGLLFGSFGWKKFKDFKEEQEAKLPQLVKDIVEQKAKAELEAMKANLQKDFEIMGKIELLEIRTKNQKKIREAQDEIRSDFSKITANAGKTIQDHTERFDGLEDGFKKDKLTILDFMTGINYIHFVHLGDISETPIKDNHRTNLLKTADYFLVRALNHDPHQLRIKANILEWRAFVSKRLLDYPGCYLLIREAIELHENLPEKERSVTHRTYSNGACYACLAGDYRKTKEWIEKGAKIDTLVLKIVEDESETDLAQLRLQPDYAEWLDTIKQKYIRLPPA